MGEEIDRHLLEADIVLLLVSASFFDSDYCWGNEMKKALALHREKKARVVPVILHPCRWTRTPLNELQAVPKDGKPISEWVNEYAACDDVASQIAQVAEELRRAEEAQRKAAEEERQLAEARRRPEEQEARPKAEEKRQPVEAEEQEEEHWGAEQEETRRKAEKRQRAEMRRSVEEQRDKRRAEEQAQATVDEVPAPGEEPKSVCTRCGGTGKIPRRYATGYGLADYTWDEKCPFCGGTGK